MSLFSNFVKQAQKEAGKQLKGFEGSVKTELKGAKDTILTEIRGAGNTLGLNLDQDFMPKIEINMPTLPDMSLNLDQDLSRISVRGLQEELVKRGDQVQQELIKIGTAGQEALVQAGKAAQEQAVRAGAAMQQNAINFGTQVSGGQSNPTLEGYANQLTKGAESQAAQITKYMEEKVIPFAGDVAATAYGDKNPAVEIRNTLVGIAEDNTGGIEALPTDFMNFFNPPKPSEPQAVGGDNLASAPTIGDPDELPMEQATSKAGQKDEEERLRRMRRLLLNRYGREDTILSGGGDTQSRRRYAL